MANELGINLFSVYKDLSNDYYGTLERMAQIGYRNVELLSMDIVTGRPFSDHYDAQSLKAKFEQLGITAISTHQMLPQDQDLLAYDWDDVIRYNSELGCMNIVIPWLWFNDREETLRIAEQINIVGKRLADHGMQLYYHNHGHEFRAVGDKTLFDLLVQHTEARHLKFQFDLIWIELVGYDPLVAMEKLGERCDMVHQNDISPTISFDKKLFFEKLVETPSQASDIMQAYMDLLDIDSFTNLGEGSFDFATFYKEVNARGHVQYTIVENETSSDDKLVRVERDYHFMKKYV